MKVFVLNLRFLAATCLFFCATSARATIVDVYAYNFDFSIHPQGMPVVAATITEGDSIRWVWGGGNHTTTSVAASPEQWDAPINGTNHHFIRQFNTAGVYWYYCTPHGSDNGNGTASGMASTITVLPATSGACCLSDGSCQTLSEEDCTSASGTFGGIGSLCDTTSCTGEIIITAIKDNVLYESMTGDTSNGMGLHVFSGKSADGIRRAVIAFETGDIPFGAEVDSARLNLYCTASNGDPASVTLHRLNQNWGEGASAASGDESLGAPAQDDDATWLYAYHDTTAWTDVGGSFNSAASATETVTMTDSNYTWRDPNLSIDVQHWLDSSGTNFGWIVRGDEINTGNTKRFASRQDTISVHHPKLTVNYIVPPSGACCLPDASCAQLTERLCDQEGGVYQGHGTLCEDVTCSVLLTPFLDELPIPSIAIPESGNIGGAAHYRITMDEVFQQLHSELPPTRVWGYNGMYPGPTFETFRDSLVTVEWVNDIRVYETNALRETHVFHVDTCVHGPNITGQVPVAVVHLHGGKVPPESDGYPEDAFPPGDSSPVYFYPNIQPAGALWYHDHALGITRLNVMMGLAGLYVIRDTVEQSLDLPSGAYEIPLILQDRSFNADGSLQYPEALHEHFFGNSILVNGKVWPYMYVHQGKYRFRALNGSNSRTYTLHLSSDSSFTQIGAELGLLESPEILDSIVMMPGERYDFVIDFSSYPPGTEILLTNSAPAPFPGAPGVGIVPNVMKFIVQDMPGHTNPLPGTLAEVEELLEENSEQERIFELFKMSAPPCNGHAHQMWTINGLMWGAITEFPVIGSTEIWTWHNESAISHPMHMHLVAFQVLNRQALNETTGEPEGPFIEPLPGEKGWKDTVNSPPGYRTRVIARFDGFTGLFPYHCHILEHEDHEMMRQYELNTCLLVTNTFNSGPGSLRYAVTCAESGDTIAFHSRLLGDTITLTEALLLDKDLTIIHVESGTITISGAVSDNLFEIEAAVSVELRHLELISGIGANGRALLNHGQLELDDVTIYDSLNDPMGNIILNTGLLTTKNNCSILFSGG